MSAEPLHSSLSLAPTSGWYVAALYEGPPVRADLDLPEQPVYTLAVQPLVGWAVSREHGRQWR